MDEGTEFPFDYDLLAELTEATGPPGYEDEVRAIVRRELEAATDRVESDAMGNVVGTVEAEGDYSVVVAAHMDEIGFMVRGIDDGFLALDPLGGWDPTVVTAQRVTVRTDDGPLRGVVGSPPPHTTDGDEAGLDLEELRVDLGLPAETVEQRVSVGDVVTMEQATEVVGDLVSGKALDDRVCVFAMLAAARRLDAPDVTVHFAATVQEEVGIRGAEALGVDLDPDLAVALDVTVADDVPRDDDGGEPVTELGDGAAVKLKDSSVLTNPKVHRRLRSVAEERGIPHQIEVLPKGGTDTAALQTAAGATPVGAISIPTRYLHTVTESAHGDDIAAAVDLLAGFLETETGDHDYRL